MDTRGQSNAQLKECKFREAWQAWAAPLVTCLGVFSVIGWALGLRDIMRFCRWHRGFCMTSATASVTGMCWNLYFLIWLPSKAPNGISERARGFSLVASITCSMVVVMSLRDYKEMPRASREWITDWHAFSILMLQLPTQSAAYLHGLNLLCYVFYEAHAYLNIGGPMFAGGVTRIGRTLLFDAVLPLLANAACEALLRRNFAGVHGNGIFEHPAVS